MFERERGRCARRTCRVNVKSDYHSGREDWSAFWQSILVTEINILNIVKEEVKRELEYTNQYIKVLRKMMKDTIAAISRYNTYVTANTQSGTEFCSSKKLFTYGFVSVSTLKYVVRIWFSPNYHMQKLNRCTQT